MEASCQWCKVLLLLCCEDFEAYGGKFYHRPCFEKLEALARRTGGVL